MWTGANPELPIDPITRMTPLMAAIKSPVLITPSDDAWKKKHASCQKILYLLLFANSKGYLSNGVDVEQRGAYGNTALSWASISGNVSAIDLLVNSYGPGLGEPGWAAVPVWALAVQSSMYRHNGNVPFRGRASLAAANKAGHTPVRGWGGGGDSTVSSRRQPALGSRVLHLPHLAIVLI